MEPDPNVADEMHRREAMNIPHVPNPIKLTNFNIFFLAKRATARRNGANVAKKPPAISEPIATAILESRLKFKIPLFKNKLLDGQ